MQRPHAPSRSSSRSSNRAAAEQPGCWCLYTPDQTVRLAEKWREQRRSIVFTNGCFDLLHAGHLYLLNEALHRGNRLIVAVNSDEYVRSHKGPARPVQPATVRAAMVALMSAADAVTVFDEETPEGLLAAIRPDVYVLGGDYDGRGIRGAEYVRRLVLLPRLPGLSTTQLLENGLVEPERQASGFAETQFEAAESSTAGNFEQF